MKTLQCPAVHLNGTSKDDLLHALRTAHTAVCEAIGALLETAPHARDYYVIREPTAYSIAREQFNSRYAVLASVRDELANIAVAIQDGKTTIEVRERNND